ncbi:putative adp-ribosylation crystallin j1 protein [Phaeoacremonium minimum UCRPA7]|uniref:Putative adp-ribosylation crystallin j1 protein n=1 Tax=Phaeoacremonium minimum (strain UCR-PA7) TaxID=1286976 RepID=R8BLS8_PHAM7|nr:putative adp-ribosylation crystallin j1 protein [Phaeoacremonium minimum UCRPA7]EOO00292.1 putative adp-ribosylation crystallin j1 protein [Phaeoacremonium minimum UCRPA7]
MTPLSGDYLERVYAGVLGKLIGVYLGRPFEGWTHQRILQELGPIRSYVHDRLNVPLVVTDDDVSGTFTFLRAFEEHGVSPDLSAEAIGKTWLNNIIEGRTILWWGGRGISTEHTAYLNLKNGIPAPASGSIETNGKTVAEQIGAQIFIDGWAMVAPGNPALAAKLAEQAGKVSHDGESVHAAKLWAAMEAEAFVSKDVEHLLETGLKFVPEDSAIARLISDVRAWTKEDGDWMTTRNRIEKTYGYDKFCGNCHVMPNHGIMIMALLYGGHDFHEAMHIINTCGWDTDCNSGNVGCLVAIMHGISSFDGGPDWRGPLADRALISSSDGGYSINDAAKIAMNVANLGRRLAGVAPLAPPKDGAQFHFTLPGSIQGFKVSSDGAIPGLVTLKQAIDGDRGPGLEIRLAPLGRGLEPVEVMTQTFTGKDVLQMGSTYPLMASPLVYPGQKVKARLRSKSDVTASLDIRLRIKTYGKNDELVPLYGPLTNLNPGEESILEWTIPDAMDSQPIQQIGLAIAAANEPVDGSVWLDSLGWEGVPDMILRRPTTRPSDFWHRAWVQGVDLFHRWMSSSISIAQNRGEGILIHGTREWTDYKIVASSFIINIGQPAGVAIRVQGLNRWYAVLFVEGGKLALVKALDERRIELATTDFKWKVDTPYEMAVSAEGDIIKARVGDVFLEAADTQFENGGVGLVVTNGSLSVESISISPAGKERC